MSDTDFSDLKPGTRVRFKDFTITESSGVRGSLGVMYRGYMGDDSTKTEAFLSSRFAEVLELPKRKPKVGDLVKVYWSQDARKVLAIFKDENGIEVAAVSSSMYEHGIIVPLDKLEVVG